MSVLVFLAIGALSVLALVAVLAYGSLGWPLVAHPRSAWILS